MTEKQFPAKFFWGAATASYQVEGGIENCDWAQAAREGRVPECGRACDHFHRYEEDFALAKKLGHTAHRFSLEWARIEPEDGQFDDAAIAHYQRVIRACKEYGLLPVVTLWHFTLPLWFSESGGFERADAPEKFARYAKKCAEEFGNEVTMITTMNEPNVFATQGWINGEWPPFKVSKKPWQRSYTGTTINKRAKLLAGLNYFRVTQNLAQAHRLAYDEIKRVHPTVRVSVVKHIHVYLPPKGLLNHLRALFSNYFQNHRFLRKVAGSLDEIGVNYYQASRYGVELTDRKTDMGWNYSPEYIYEALLLMQQYQKPLFVSEAGIADHDDSDRAEYIEKQVDGTWRAIQDGVDVRGHLYWSLMDNYEWALGFEKKFGLVEIDYDTLERKPRPSAFVYKEIIEQNAVVE